MHAHIHMNTHACTLTCTHTYTHTHMHTRMHTHMHAHAHAHTHTLTHINTHTQINPYEGMGMGFGAQASFSVGELLRLFCTNLQEQIKHRMFFYKSATMVREGMIVVHNSGLTGDPTTAKVGLRFSSL